MILWSFQTKEAEAFAFSSLSTCPMRVYNLYIRLGSVLLLHCIIIREVIIVMSMSVSAGGSADCGAEYYVKENAKNVLSSNAWREIVFLCSASTRHVAESWL